MVLDMSRFLGDREVVPQILKASCDNHGFGYIPVYDDLLRAQVSGVRLRWPHDLHLNEAGNAVLADAVYRWFTKTSASGQR